MSKGILICLCLTLAGCTLIPAYHRPASPVPPRYLNMSPSAMVEKAKTSDIGWQGFFKDPRLRKLIELALKNNRDYKVALLNVEQLRAQYRILGYALLPTFEIDASSIEQRQLVTNNKYVKSHNYNISLNSSYELDLFGHIRSLKAQVLEQYLATQEASRAARISLVAAVGIQYLTERALDEQLQLLQLTLKSVESYEDLINKSYQLGNASALALYESQAQLQSIKVAIATDERLYAQARDSLVLLVGETLPQDLPSARPLEEGDLMADLPVGLSSDLMERRPDILEAEHQLKAANANIGVVKAAFFPSITLTASDGTASVQLSKLFYPGTNVGMISPQISLPLLNQTTNLANLDAARVGKEIQVAQYEKAIQVAFKEVADAIVARDTLNQELAAQRSLVQAQQKRYDLSGLRYTQGLDNYLSVLLSQQALYSAQENLIQVSIDRLTNLISLYKALGGGWKE